MFQVENMFGTVKKRVSSPRTKIIQETSSLLVKEILGQAQLNELEAKIILNQLIVDGEIKDTSEMQKFQQELPFPSQLVMQTLISQVSLLNNTKNIVW